MVKAVSELTPYGVASFTTQPPHSSSLPIGGLVTSLASGNPLGLATSVLGSLNITENISNVLQYGLSSWGASTNPTDAKQFFESQIKPVVVNLLSNLSESNMEANLKRASMILEHGIALYKHKVARHFKAGSSIEAGKLNIQLYTSFRDNTLKPIVADLKSQGVLDKTLTATANDSELKGMIAGGDDPYLHQDGPLKYPYWTLKQSFFTQAIQTLTGGSSSTDQTLGTTNPPMQASSSGIGGAVAIGLGIWALKKIF